MKKFTIFIAYIIFTLILLNSFNSNTFESSNPDILNIEQKEKERDLRVRKQISDMEEHYRKVENNKNIRIVVIDSKTGKKLY